jgi:hypothetical protein
VAGLNPAAWAGLMFQPKKQIAGYCACHSNPLYIIIFHFAAERELLTFCMQMVNTAEEPEKGRRERGGWADGGSW